MITYITILLTACSFSSTVSSSGIPDFDGHPEELDTLMAGILTNSEVLLHLEEFLLQNEEMGNHVTEISEGLDAIFKDNGKYLFRPQNIVASE